MANYWDRTGNRTPVANPNAPKAIQSAQAQVADIRAAGGQPSEALMAQAIEEMITQQEAQPTGLHGIQSKPSSPFDPALEFDPVKRVENVKGVMPDWRNQISASAPTPEYNGPSLAESKAGTQGMLGDMVDSVFGIGKLVADQANQSEADAQSPEALMEMLRKQYGSYQYGGPSAETMTNREFDPQFAALSQMESGTTNRYKQNSADMAGLYKAYADDVLSGRDANAQAYAGATKTINDTYSGAQTNVTNNMNDATKEMGAQLALLGQQEAAPAVLQEKQAVLGEQLGDLSKAQGASAALNTQLGANTYAADTASHGVAQQAGLNAGQELMGQYEQLMNQYGAQRLGLEGAKGQALNNYGMNIEGLIQKGNSGIQEQIAKSFGDLLGQQDRTANREIQQGRLDLDLQKFLADQSGPSADPSKMNPYDALLDRSGQYNTDPTEAANDAEIVYKTALGDPGAQNMSVLMNLLEENNPGWLAQPGNKALAYDYFNRILGQKQ
jgi:hypothetical protein